MSSRSHGHAMRFSLLVVVVLTCLAIGGVRRQSQAASQLNFQLARRLGSSRRRPFAISISRKIRHFRPPPTAGVRRRQEFELPANRLSFTSSQASQTSQQPGGPGQRLTQSKIRLADVRRAMNGKNLTCLGVHPTFNQAVSVELDVQYVPSVSVVQREYSIVEGSPLSISCQVDANPAPSLVNWRLVNDGSHGKVAPGVTRTSSSDKEAQLANKQGPVLEFVHIGREYNQNVFECLAQNSLGISTPADVKLNILYTPFLLNASTSQSVPFNSEARLFCLFDGNPRPEIRWFYTDPLSRTATALQVDQTATTGQQRTNKERTGKDEPHSHEYLTIPMVSYRNEGDYHCEARNTINGEQYAIRSSNMALDVFGEPQFLVGQRAPVMAKAVQGNRADISLTFCSDPQPHRVFWQFGSIRLDVRSNYIVAPPNGAGATAPPLPSAGVSASNGKLAHAAMQRFQVHPLVALQKRDSSFSKVPTCFEVQLTLLEPELSDQRDYVLYVQNERTIVNGTVRLRVTSPLSPTLMITSAFVFICALFLLSFIVLFVFKKRHLLLAAGSAANGGPTTNGNSNSNNGGRAQSNGHSRRSTKSQRETNGGQTSTTTNGNTADGLLQTAINGQTKGVVNGAGNGLADGASNPNLEQQQQQHKSHQLVNGLMSMASSDTSCTNDQKQLLANCTSSSSASSTSSSSSTQQKQQQQPQPLEGDGRSTANSTPGSTPMNHISVDDELQLNGSYQATESVTRHLSPALTASGAGTGGSALIYANIGDYSTSSTAASRRANEPVEFTNANFVPDEPAGDNSKRNLQAHRQRQQMPMVDQQQQQQHSPTASSLDTDGRPSVGATIAMMNSLAAAAGLSPTQSLQQATGALNGAISQQMAAGRGQTRRPGPPKPPKPSIQQRSRFYQQQAAAAAAAQGGLVMIGNSQLAFGAQNESNGEQPTDLSANELAVEYSRLAFPARAEL